MCVREELLRKWEFFKALNYVKQSCYVGAFLL